MIDRKELVETFRSHFMSMNNVLENPMPESLRREANHKVAAIWALAKDLGIEDHELLGEK